jgi:S1-C subfamily serine protease
VQESWNETVNRVSSGVVSIQIDTPFAFDGRWNRGTVATGFVVDAEQGIILTNRHVVTPGPVTAKAILTNNEEIELSPLYFDPVHDFGFFKYDPSQIKHSELHEFTLSDIPPSIGDSIRIIGNDAGQKISILDGTISRLDREAPRYGKGKYNDFNTFYIQAATSSTGGSSGSPVINIKGEAVALNAGSQTKSANAFYLPLEKIKQALAQLRQGKAIDRGTLQTTFTSTTYAELNRLGLNESLEREFRSAYPNLKGLLVVNSLIPDSSADAQLEVGDILLRINQQRTASFSELEETLNANVGKNIDIQVLRQGELFEYTLYVDDLHRLTPQSLVKFDGSIFHDLSYQQARHFNKPIEGVYVAASNGYFSRAGVPNRSVIVEFNGVATPHAQALNEELLKLSNGEKVHVRYYDFSTPNTTNYARVEINRKWFEHSVCEKSENLSYWPCENIEFVTAEPDELVSDKLEPSNSERLEDALVRVSYYSPYSIQGRSSEQGSYGTGVVVDAEKGWVVIPRSVVASMLGDVKITFNNRYEIPGKVEFIHPLHNLALVSYEPARASQASISEAVFSTAKMKKGETVMQMGLNYDGNVEYRATEVDTTEEFWLRRFNVPQFVDKNLQATHFINPNTSFDGVLVNGDQQIVGLWMIFDASADNGKDQSNSIAGLASEYVLEVIESARTRSPIYSLDIDLTMIAPVDATQMGLGMDWLEKIVPNEVSQTTGKRSILAIYNISNSSDSAAFLKRRDLLLAINDIPVSSFRQVELLSQAPEVKVTFFSQGQVRTETIKTNALSGVDIDRVLYWSGLYLHAPHRAAQLQGNVDSQGVYIASYKYGSPATRYGLYAIQRIVEVDGKTITTLDDFIEAVQDKAHLDSVLIKTIDFSNNPKVVTLRVNNHYWPFYELRWVNGEWTKHNYALVGA